MKSPFGFVWGISLACLMGNAQSAELELEGNRLMVSGMLDGSAIKAFEEYLASGRVRTVVFENSLGGTPEVANDYARAIRATGVNTEAKGQCHAACAYAFLAGKEHRFGRGFQVNGLLIPVAGRPRPSDLGSRGTRRAFPERIVPCPTCARSLSPNPCPPAPKSSPTRANASPGGLIVRTGSARPR